MEDRGDLSVEPLNLEPSIGELSYFNPNLSNVPSFSISSRKRRSINCSAFTCLARGSVWAISSRLA